MVTKKCIICGKEFTTENNSQKLCDDDHYVKCSICGKEYVTRNTTLLKAQLNGDIVTCDNRECRYEARKRRSLMKYGVESHLQLPSVRSKIYESYLNNKLPDRESKYKELNNSKEISKTELSEKLEEILISRSIDYDRNIYIEGYTYSFLVRNEIVLNIIDCPNNIANETYLREYNNMLKSIALKHYNRYISVYSWDNLDKIVALLSDKQTIYARQCTISEVDKNECSDFLNTYHLQGTCRYQSIRIGLYYKNKLVQIMTFGKPRYNDKYQYELLRLCSRSEYMIVGGSERLLKYFINKYDPKNIVSYCDRSRFNGHSYENLGFKLLYNTSARRHWYKGTSHITDNLLKRHGYDQLFNTSYGKGYSNVDLMRNNGWKEVYDCGQSTYVMILAN